VLETTTVAAGMKNTSDEIVLQTEEALAGAWDSVCGPESEFASKKPDGEIQGE